MLGVTLAMALLPAGLQVTNIEAGTVVRYPLILLKGTAPEADLTAGLTWRSMNKAIVNDGRFIALVDLKPGKNMVLLNSGRQILKMRLDYRPMTTPYRVRAVYVAPKDEPTNFDALPGMQSDRYGEKLDTVLKLLQCFCAEAMNDAGYGRKTFPLEFDSKDRVVVHVVKSTRTGTELRSLKDQTLYAAVWSEVSKDFNYNVDKCCTLMSFTRFDPTTKQVHGHTALGGGGLALFGGASMWSWPTYTPEIQSVLQDETLIDGNKVFDDSAGRGTLWGLASTTIGAMMHEMGHTFGLPHSIDRQSVMSRGFDLLNRTFTLSEPPHRYRPSWLKFPADEVARWDPFFAARLNWNPWFQPDGLNGHEFLRDSTPTLERDAGTGEIVVKSQYGLRVVGAESDDHPSTFKSYSEEPPKVVRMKESDLFDKVGNSRILAYALDDQGNENQLLIER